MAKGIEKKKEGKKPAMDPKEKRRKKRDMRQKKDC